MNGPQPGPTSARFEHRLADAEGAGDEAGQAHRQGERLTVQAQVR